MGPDGCALQSRRLAMNDARVLDSRTALVEVTVVVLALLDDCLGERPDLSMEA